MPKVVGTFTKQHNVMFRTKTYIQWGSEEHSLRLLCWS